MTELTMVVFVVLGFAGWRVASLVANENGPFYIFRRLREFAERCEDRSRLLKAFHFCEMLNCEWCNSIWIGMALVLLWLRFGSVVVYVSLVLAISTVTIVLKYIVQNLEAALNERELLVSSAPQTKVEIHSLDEVLS